MIRNDGCRKTRGAGSNPAAWLPSKSATYAIGAEMYRRGWLPLGVIEYGGQLFKRKCKSQVEPRCMVKVGDPYGFL